MRQVPVGEVKVFAEKQIINDCVSLYFRKVDYKPEGKMGGFWGKLVFEEEEDGATPGWAGHRISETAAQNLMDHLWECGLRPTEGKGSAGALAAVQGHLEDMRRISFGLMGLGEQKGT